MKRVINLGLALAMCFSLLSSAYAVEEKNLNVMSFEDYYIALKVEYAKYNMNLEILDHDDSFVYTKEFLDEKIASLNSYMDTAEFDTDSGTFLHFIDCEENASEDNAEGQSLLRIMPVTEDHKFSATVFAPVPCPGSAELEININATENAQNGTFMSINSVTSRQYGYALNFKSWTQTDQNLAIPIYNNSKINGCVYGTLVIEFNEPRTSSVIRNTSDHTINVSISL